MAMLPKLKLKALVSFPSNVYGGTGIGITKTNGNFTINLDYSEFPTTGTLPPNTEALVWDPVTDTYYLVPPSSVGGISDAPSDNKMYGRINRAWVDAWASPVLTGNPTAPTPTAGDNDTSVATTAFVASAITGSVAGVASIGSKAGVITLNGGSMATNELPAPRYDVAQTLTLDSGTTMGQRSQARQNIYAAPFDALAYNGMQINGSMDVSQENGATTVDATGIAKYVLDQWRVVSVGPQVAYCGQGASPNPLGFAGHLFVYFNVTGNPSPAGGDHCIFLHTIEGYRMSRLAWGTVNAQPITIGFWVFAVRTGMYSGSIRNTAGTPDRSYVFTFTVNASNTWEYKTATIPGDTAGGKWNAIINNAGMHISFSVMAGATKQTAAGSWVAGDFMGATGTTNGAAAGTDSMKITGVVVLPGIEAPSAARSPLIMRPYDQELVTCMRYWEDGKAAWNGSSTNGMIFSTLIYYKQTKRSAPTITQTNTLNTLVGAANNDGTQPGPLLGFKSYRFGNASGQGEWIENWTANARL